MKLKEEALIEALVLDIHAEDGWLSDAQSAQLEWDEGNRSVRFCGEGSIDIGHLVSIARYVWASNDSR